MSSASGENWEEGWEEREVSCWEPDAWRERGREAPGAQMEEENEVMVMRRRKRGMLDRMVSRMR